MNRKKKIFITIILVAFLAILMYLFWGPLFPWNPVKIGYEKIESSKATIYIQDKTDQDSVVYRINEIIKEEEKFHDLKYTDDFKIIILNEKNTMKRFLPWMKGSGYSVSLSLANLVYIGPLARKSATGIEAHLRHELSHLLIDQNTTFKKARIIHNQGWLAEGIAEYFSGHSFYTRDEFIELCKRGNFQFTGLHEKNPLKMSIREVRLKYTYYGFFIEFLDQHFGLEKLQRYLKKYIETPDDCKKLFEDVYSYKLDDLLEQFHSSLGN